MIFADDPTHDPNVDRAQDRWKLKIHSNFLTLARRKNQLKSGVRTEQVIRTTVRGFLSHRLKTKLIF